MLTRLNVLRILIVLLASYKGLDKNIELLSDCFKVRGNNVMK